LSLRAAYAPFGEYRIQPSYPTSEITDRGFTGHRHNDYIKLIYMGARWYLPYLNRFLSADTIVPNPANPQSFNRYSYTLNNPVNFTDPTGHRECGPWEDCSEPLPNEPPRPNIVDFFSSSCNGCSQYDPKTYGNVQGAYDIYQQIGPLSPAELLASIIASEFATLKELDPVNYNLALEALAREFYDACPEGICRGDSLWKFLGGLAGWTTGISADHYTSGEYKQYLGDARAILNNEEWRSGAATGRPWTWGNKNQMFSEDEYARSSEGHTFTVNHGEFVSTYTMGYLGISNVVDPNNPLIILSHGQQLARFYYRKNYPICGTGSTTPCIVPP
jgi:RHS repeat-associated protein